MRWFLAIGIAGVVVGAGLWIATAPDRLDASNLPSRGDPQAGAQVFTAAGCASCHVAPDADKDADGPPVLAGGLAFKTQFGTFYAPNISPDPAHGIGDWSDADILNATLRGVSPGGAHYYPALPYGSYIKADPAKMADMVAYLRGLPASDQLSRDHDVQFPFNIRRALGLWKMLFLSDDWVLPDDRADDPTLVRGRELVETLAHCGECHTPRNLLGGLKTGAWLTGAANPSGEGRIPGIAPGQMDWSDADLRAFLTTGLTPDYDSAGGEMVAVIDKLSQLPDEDIAAIIAYLRAIPAAEAAADSE